MTNFNPKTCLKMQGWSHWEQGDMKPCGKRPREVCPVKKGYGMGLSGKRPLQNATLYSVLDKLPKTIMPTLEKSRTRQSDWQAQFQSIKDLIQTNAVPFFVQRVNPDVSIDLDPNNQRCSPSSADGSGSSRLPQICLTGWIPQVLSHHVTDRCQPTDLYLMTTGSKGNV